jgi:hypothetical protein
MINALLLVAGTSALLHLTAAESHCTAFAKIQKETAKVGGAVEKMTTSQWNFLRGIHALNPTTPPGLPPGDGAVLVTLPRTPDSGLVFFIDGTLACNVMNAPSELIKLLGKVKSGDANHEGDAL